MEHSGDAAFPDRLVQDVGSVILGVTGVNHERQAGLASGLDVRLKALALRSPLRIVVMIVEPAFADGDHTRM